jgi:hypothetical protein
VVGEGEQALGQRAIQGAPHVLDAERATGVQVGAPDVADEQRVAGQHEPGLVAAAVVGDDVGVMRRRVPGRGHREHLGIAEADDIAVGERMVVEGDSGCVGEVGRRARARDELGQPRDVVGVHVGLEDRDDRHALGLRLRDVAVDEVDVRIGHGEGAVGLAAEQVGRARGLVVEELAEVHDAHAKQAPDMHLEAMRDGTLAPLEWVRPRSARPHSRRRPPPCSTSRGSR